MRYRFRLDYRLIIVRGDLDGPADSLVLRLALVTGASHTSIDTSALESVGIATDAAAQKISMTTPIGVGHARKVTVNGLAALGHIRSDFSVMTHPFPKQLRIDGVLGLDFLRERKLVIDFRRGFIQLK